MQTGKTDNEWVSGIREKLNSLAVPMEQAEFSREEYNRLFPEGKIKTPVGIVKLGNDQYDKLIRTNRKNLLGAMRQTLAEPIVVLPEVQGGRKSKLFIKSFKNMKDSEASFVMTVVVEDGQDSIAISTGPRKKKQIERKIKETGIPLYISTRGVAAQLIGTDGNNPATQQDIVSPQSPETSSPMSNPLFTDRRPGAYRAG
jgi:hypothetical protein